MYAWGLRTGEAAALKITSIDSANRLLRIIGKGNKERRVPLPQPVLNNPVWQTHKNPQWLFPNNAGANSVARRVLYLSAYIGFVLAIQPRNRSVHGRPLGFTSPFSSTSMPSQLAAVEPPSGRAGRAAAWPRSRLRP
jgi:hypothetical protein